jgi:hypothetical protein
MLVMVLVGGFVVQFLRKKIGVEKMKAIKAELAAKQEIVDTVVLFVQQVYEAYDGKDKFTKQYSRHRNGLRQRALQLRQKNCRV